MKKAVSITRVAVLLLLGWVAGTGRLSAAEKLTNVTFDQDYELFYQQQFRTLSARAEKAIPRAYHHVIQLWGLEDTAGLRHPLAVQIKKIPSDTLQRWEAAYVRSQGEGNNLRQWLVLDIGAYMQNPSEDVERILAHEMSHVIIRDVLSDLHGTRIPPWFNEGLAQSSTPEGHERVRNDMIKLALSDDPLLLCDLDGPVDEFAHGPFNGNCYPEFYLAVQRLKQLGGPQTLAKVINGLNQGTDMTVLVRSITGREWPDFKKDVDQYTRAVFDGEKQIP